ncbi:MAG TPA: RNA polymerase sigma factor [Saprospiraceae bacterium]|nr:RNA polymerase sigma factor [Saprospiraceae bacterium]
MEVLEMVEACLRGDRISQKKLFDLFAGRMLAVCMRYSKHRMEAEDLLQDGFIRVFMNLDQFKNEGPLEQWIRRIMINNAIKKYHKKSNQNESYTIDTVVEEGVQPDAIDQISEQEMMDMIAELPDGYRMVFNLFAIEGYSHKEISEMMHIEESTSRSQLAKARKVLQDKIIKNSNFLV